MPWHSTSELSFKICHRKPLPHCTTDRNDDKFCNQFVPFGLHVISNNYGQNIFCRRLFFFSLSQSLFGVYFEWDIAARAFHLTVNLDTFNIHSEKKNYIWHKNRFECKRFFVEMKMVMQSRWLPWCPFRILTENWHPSNLLLHYIFIRLLLFLLV